MKNPVTSLNKFRADLTEKYRWSVQLVENQLRASFSSVKEEHEQFVSYAKGLISAKQHELDSLKKVEEETSIQKSGSKEKDSKKRVRNKNKRTRNQAVHNYN